jgi:drug/metabolite transporter (DMT)-like permease
MISSSPAVSGGGRLVVATAAGTGMAWLMMIAAVVCLAFVPFLVRAADVGPGAAGFWRMVLALPLLAAWSATIDRRQPVATPASGARRRGFLAAIAAGLAFTGDLFFFHRAIGTTTVANAALLCQLAPVMVVAALWIFGGERPGRGLIAGLGLALAGAWLLVRDTGDRAGADIMGDLSAVAAAACYAAYLIAIKAARRSIATGTTMLVTTAVSALGLGLLAVASGEVLMPSSLAGWAAVAALGILAHAGGQGLATAALGRLPVGAASLLLLIQPVITAAFGWPIEGEMPSLVQVAGAMLLLAALATANPALRPAWRRTGPAPLAAR